MLGGLACTGSVYADRLLTCLISAYCTPNVQGLGVGVVNDRVILVDNDPEKLFGCDVKNENLIGVGWGAFEDHRLLI